MLRTRENIKNPVSLSRDSSKSIEYPLYDTSIRKIDYDENEIQLFVHTYCYSRARASVNAARQ